MKKLISLFGGLLCASVQSQITPDISIITPGTQTSYFYHTKLGLAGYKYVIVDRAAKTITLFNLNNSIYKTINIPITGTTTAYSVSHLSDNMFDLNNDIEYVVNTYITGSEPPQLYIFKENGTTMFYRDSAALSVSSDEVHLATSGIYKVPSGLKMKIFRFTTNQWFASRVEIFDLGGVMPCIECSSTGTVTGIGEAGDGPGEDAVFYPNPASQELRLRYELPPHADKATIQIQDLSGRIVEQLEVSRNFDHVKLPASYNSGLYFYSLYAEGELIKTEKVVLQN